MKVTSQLQCTVVGGSEGAAARARAKGKLQGLAGLAWGQRRRLVRWTVDGVGGTAVVVVRWWYGAAAAVVPQ